MTSKRAVPRWLAVTVIGLLLFATVTAFFSPAQAAPTSSPAAAVKASSASAPVSAPASAPASTPVSQPAVKPNPDVIVGQDYHHDTSPALRDMPKLTPKVQPIHEASPRLATGIVHKDAPDGSAVQRIAAPAAMPAPILNFDGIPFPGVVCNCAPPDTNGAVGANPVRANRQRGLPGLQ